MRLPDVLVEAIFHAVGIAVVTALMLLTGVHSVDGVFPLTLAFIGG